MQAQARRARPCPSWMGSNSLLLLERCAPRGIWLKPPPLPGDKLAQNGEEILNSILAYDLAAGVNPNSLGQERQVGEAVARRAYDACVVGLNPGRARSSPTIDVKAIVSA